MDQKLMTLDDDSCHTSFQAEPGNVQQTCWNNENQVGI